MLEATFKRAAAGAGTPWSVGSLAGIGHRVFCGRRLRYGSLCSGDGEGGRTMSWKQRGPLRSGNRESARSPFERSQSYRLDQLPQPFCELYSINLVDEFPSRCIYRISNPFSTLFDLRDAAYRELGRRDDLADLTSALELLDQLDTCADCMDVNLTHRTVRRLRRELGVST